MNRHHKADTMGSEHRGVDSHIVRVYVDGCCEPVNPGGIATYGFVVYVGSKKVYEENGVIGVGALGDDVSNNVAEYIALINALKYILDSRFRNKEIIIFSDSQLVVRQIKGRYRVRAPRLVVLHQKAMELLSKIRNCRVEWIPREMNEEADRLSKKAYIDFIRNNEELVRRYYAKYLISRDEIELLKAYGIDVEYWMSKIEARRLLRKLKREKFRAHKSRS